MKTWQPVARVRMDDYDDMGAVSDALSSVIRKRFGGATMVEGGYSSLLILFKGQADEEAVRDWAKQWLENHPHLVRQTSRSGKSTAQIKREIVEVLGTGRRR